jgi:hypothetical protein
MSSAGTDRLPREGRREREAAAARLSWDSAIGFGGNSNSLRRTASTSKAPESQTLLYLSRLI